MGPSQEQLNVITSLINKHVVVDSVAGCGKTTTIKYAAMAFRREQILVLTYNVKQRANTKQEMARLGIKNVHVNTYHSCGYRFYGPECSRDSGIRKVIEDDEPARNIDNKFSMIIIDEVQDMTGLYYALAKKLIKDICTNNVRIMILGDFMQGINVFNGASIEYILNPTKYFGGEWVKCGLSVTFRLTPEMVDFVNVVNESFGTGFRRLISAKSSSKKPTYYVCNMSFVHGMLLDLLKVRRPHEIMVLTPTTRKSKRITDLCNLLFKDGVPIYVTGDNESVENMAGKLVISTIHSVKGDERPVVVLLGFDDSVLPKMLGKESTNTNSVIYVALTRAKEELIICHEASNAFIVPREIIEQYCDFRIISSIKKNYVNRKHEDKGCAKAVTDMVKYLSNDIKVECMKHIIVERLVEPSESLATYYNVPNTVPSKVGGVEEVSDINGFLVPAFQSRFTFDYTNLRQYFGELYQGNPLLGLINRYISEISEFSDSFIFDPYCGINELLRVATIYNCLHNRLLYRIEQIRNFDWVSYAFLDECSNRINSYISDNAIYEVVARKGDIIGVVDILDDEYVYELKCTSMIEEEHILQLALYAYIMPGKKYRLLNVYTGELISIQCDATRVAEILLRR